MSHKSGNSIMAFWKGWSPPSKGEALGELGCQEHGGAMQLRWAQLNLTWLETELQELFMQAKATSMKPLQVEGNTERDCKSTAWGGLVFKGPTESPEAIGWQRVGSVRALW